MSVLSITFVTFSDQNRFATGSNNGDIKIWEDFKVVASSNLKSILYSKNYRPVIEGQLSPIESDSVFVQYDRTKIFAIAKELIGNQMIVLDLSLKVLMAWDVARYGAPSVAITVLKAFNDFVAIGYQQGNVVVLQLSSPENEKLKVIRSLVSSDKFNSSFKNILCGKCETFIFC